ncbi:hypothetical protein NIES2130_02470 [Scytonema sp. HK-05]|nr:hypothetical protein NIES2130_02470 [Scytonema sp. HK-05]
MPLAKLGTGDWLKIGNAPNLGKGFIAPSIIFRLITITPIPHPQSPVPFTLLKIKSALLT